MDPKFCKRIDCIRAEIQILNDNISKEPIYEVETPRPKASDDPEYRSFALKKFQSTFSYKTFKRREKEALRAMNSKYERVEEHIEDIDDFVEKRITKEFMSIARWDRLDKWQRKNRIEEYLKRYKTENELDFDVSKIVKQLKGLRTKDVVWREGQIQEINDIENHL